MTAKLTNERGAARVFTINDDGTMTIADYHAAQATMHTSQRLSIANVTSNPDRIMIVDGAIPVTELVR